MCFFHILTWRFQLSHPVNELILKQKQRSEEKRLKLDHPVSTQAHSNCSVSSCLQVFTLTICQYTFYYEDSVVCSRPVPLTPQNGSRWQVFQDVLSPDQENLDLANVNLMLELLVQKKKQLEAVSKGLLVVRWLLGFTYGCTILKQILTLTSYSILKGGLYKC